MQLYTSDLSLTPRGYQGVSYALLVAQPLVRIKYPLRENHAHHPQPAVLISRFMLNLRQADSNASSEQHSGSGLPVASAQFAHRSTFLGNIGEPLDHGVAEQQDNFDVPQDETVEESR